MGDIYRCTGPVMMKGIPFESYRRVGLKSQIARGTDEQLSRYRVGEVGDDRGMWLPDTHPNGLWQPPVDSLEPVRRLRRQRLLSSRLAGWWAGLEWAHPSNFLANASMRVTVQVVVLHERVHAGSRTHYALDWGPGAALRLSDDSALPLRVAHTTVVPRGGEGALASGAETHLVEPFGSVAFDYPHPPRKKQNEYVRRGEQLAESASRCSKERLSDIHDLDYIFEKASKVF
ncbi:hypothetical protein EDD16DRAFT_1725185 [Pisolithus croceorrhizus]|nr:hypothetical protein EDD16DRAFT_1725185 [Pisolithus croceorrhizus]